MTENKKLRALLAEARDGLFDREVSHDVVRCNCWVCTLARRIDAALAEPREDFVAIAAPAVRDELIQVLDNYSTLHRERDEARAEVGRAYQRGAEAMREAAAKYVRKIGWDMNPQVACSVASLPLPEDKP